MERIQERLKMVEQQLLPRGITDERLLEAMRKVPRHLFLPARVQSLAYQDSPIPIGFCQTISQPYITALMTQSLLLQGHERVLEIGTGSGYQTALLAELALQVFSVERIEQLAKAAQSVLGNLGYTNISFRIDDGSYGWPEEAPFDAILATAAAPGITDQLTKQLEEKGRMIIPVGSLQSQRLLRLIRKNGKIYQEELGGCVFVPMVGDYGYQEG
ncbi:MAG: protein-L-isoaspartate(D-aspartate) O-methyltransferase [Desulfobacterales bacterium]